MNRLQGCGDERRLSPEEETVQRTRANTVREAGRGSWARRRRKELLELPDQLDPRIAELTTTVENSRARSQSTVRGGAVEMLVTSNHTPSNGLMQLRLDCFERELSNFHVRSESKNISHKDSKRNQRRVIIICGPFSAKTGDSLDWQSIEFLCTRFIPRLSRT